MRTILLILILMAPITTAHAEYDYPWCVYGGELGPSGECLYRTREQCLASASGRWNTYCDVNRYILFQQRALQPRPKKAPRH
ncbi:MULTISPECIES: DUF3551 domain-containing protein [unclassified Bradyrhizobium]|uniref:DUF3551 domain-containing protein n=2 Tax=unclassified Bradyrhizobium TaxID=2631580 RepID=UPI00220C2B05|nr:hypothetical protein [Bradyrhizobium sp. WBOS8]MDD1582596.1 hypothetical protein [Bradyrhizobium sp. WBOS4]UUO50770.1 hypothetical protein DCM78_30025 [Bradyrhizobium sp. WBOS04]UUO58148.1 hypothetical protein DCM80_02525 [Bradyrhizobium sp. WBOS08]